MGGSGELGKRLSMAISERMSERSEPLALYGGTLKVAPWLGNALAWLLHLLRARRFRSRPFHCVRPCRYEQMSGLGSARRLPGLATPAVLQYRHLTLTLALT